uniref:small monomeric GTPase n=1 Tax=Laticauda laticaudata TaxID=8630 RepID=A0A8C5SJA2_LATLA
MSDAADQNFDYMFKLLIIGNSSVGKTSFLFRYADDSFTSDFVSTVGIDFKVKTVYRNEKRVKLQIWVRYFTVHGRQTAVCPIVKLIGKHNRASQLITGEAISSFSG